ncbi:MAG: hypothetical protein ACFFDR_06990 [Candidatus Thorarchaeota archaeon]
MKHLVLFIAVILVISNLLLLDTSDNIQGLHWGYSEGARYDFKIEEYTDLNGSITKHSEYLYSISPEYSNIPDYVGVDDSIPRISFGLFYENGTTAGERNLAVPVGNWSVYTEIIQKYALDENRSVEIIDIDTEWGYNATIIDYEYFTFSVLIIYSKSDGIIIEHAWEDRVSGFFHSRDSITRISISPVIQGLAVSGIVGIGVISVIAILSKTRDSSLE